MADADDFLSRWSRRKRAARAGIPAPEAVPPSDARPLPAEASQPAREIAAEPPPLPPVEDLTTESDFTPFMDRDVDPDLRSKALKKLFSDPRYNVMDGLDTYIDDYSQSDPIPAEWLGQLTQMAGLGDVPARQEAEKAAKERSEREAAAAAASGEPVAQARDAEVEEVLPEAVADPKTAVDPDEGQVGVTGAKAGCGTSAIPARKVGD